MYIIPSIGLPVSSSAIFSFAGMDEFHMMSVKFLIKATKLLSVLCSAIAELVWKTKASLLSIIAIFAGGMLSACFMAENTPHFFAELFVLLSIFVMTSIL